MAHHLKMQTYKLLKHNHYTCHLVDELDFCGFNYKVCKQIDNNLNTSVGFEVKNLVTYE